MHFQVGDALCDNGDFVNVEDLLVQPPHRGGCLCERISISRTSTKERELYRVITHKKQQSWIISWVHQICEKQTTLKILGSLRIYKRCPIDTCVLCKVLKHVSSKTWTLLIDNCTLAIVQVHSNGVWLYDLWVMKLNSGWYMHPWKICNMDLWYGYPRSSVVPEPLDHYPGEKHRGWNRDFS